MNKYAELKILAQFLGGFDFEVFNKLKQTQAQLAQDSLLK